MALSFWSRLGLARDVRIHCITQSLSERLKYFRQRKWLVALMSLLLGRTYSVLCLSEAACEPLAQTFNVPLSKMRAIRFGVDTTFWNPGDPQESQPEPFALSIGNDMNRDYKTLVAAAPSNVPLRIVTRKKIHTSRESIQVQSQWISAEAIREMYRTASVVIIPVEKVVYESSGLSTCLQALACGARVITAGSRALRENLANLSGVTFYEPGNVQDLHQKILTVWNSRPSSREQGLVPSAAFVGEQIEEVVADAGGLVFDRKRSQGGS